MKPHTVGVAPQRSSRSSISKTKTIFLSTKVSSTAQHKYISQVRDGKISNDDFVIFFPIDGAQLYRSKKSDCWIYISSWIILEYAPDLPPTISKTGTKL